MSYNNYAFNDAVENLELCVSSMADIIDGECENIQLSTEELKSYNRMYETCKEFIHYYELLEQVPNSVVTLD